LLVDSLYGALIDLVDSHFLRAEELTRMVIPTMARNRAEFLDPFGAEGRFAGLGVEEIEISVAKIISGRSSKAVAMCGRLQPSGRLSQGLQRSHHWPRTWTPARLRGQLSSLNSGKSA
jgi:hypothetical protein